MSGYVFLLSASVRHTSAIADAFVRHRQEKKHRKSLLKCRTALSTNHFKVFYPCKIQFPIYTDSIHIAISIAW